MSDSGGGAAGGNPRDPWRKLPVGEQGDPLLPRWFAIFALVMVPAGLIVVLVALFWADFGDVPVAERRPPGEMGWTHDAGRVEYGPAREPVAYDAPCPRLEGLRLAGDARELATLRAGLVELCRSGLPAGVHDALRAVAEGSELRFAAFARTGVDSTSLLPDQGMVLLNSRYVRTDPRWIGPLVAYEAVLVAAGDNAAATVLRARRAERDVCTTLGRVRPLDSPGCRDAAALLDLDDPLAALRAAGFR